uniref:Uncharacterized protein n=1 Tax=Chenopodium quinoa TaxID=63459 RepID=A0A803MT91_CHEQI
MGRRALKMRPIAGLGNQRPLGRLVSSYIVLLGGSLISWKSNKQGAVSKSSSKAEYMAISNAASEVTWAVRILEELGVTNLKPVTLYCDNQSTIHIAKNPIHHERNKHIEINVHFTRNKVLDDLLELHHLPTHQQLADVFTKALSGPQFKILLSKLGMTEASATSSLRGGGE